MRWRHGVTLVEVIALVWIAVSLIGVLSPVVKRARESDLQAVCLSNVRQIGVALWQYAADNHDHLPYPQSIFPRQWNSSSAQYCSRVGNVPLKAYNGTYAECLSPYLNTRSTYFCPSDYVNNQTTDDMCSYFMKPAVMVGAVLGYGAKSGFAFPASQIIFFERKGFHGGSATKGWAEGVKLNCVFMDGHAGYVGAAPKSPGGADVAVAPVSAAIIDSKWNWTQSAGFPCWYNAKGDPNQTTAPEGQAYDQTRFKDATR